MLIFFNRFCNIALKPEHLGIYFSHTLIVYSFIPNFQSITIRKIVNLMCYGILFVSLGCTKKEKRM